MKRSAEIYTLSVGGESIPYELERKAVKRLNLRVRRDGTVHASAPMRMPLSAIERFLAEKATWLQDARARVLSHQPIRLSLLSGDILYIEGVAHTVVVLAGRRQGVSLSEGQLLLTVRNPEDADERVRVLRRFVKGEAARLLTARAARIYPFFAPHPATFPQLSFRWMKSRWGSCIAAKNRITLNEKLLFVSPALADYVIFHEFCHFRYQDHSPAFYRHLATFVPDYAAARRALARTAIPELGEE